MANVFEFNGFTPVIDESAFIHQNATVTGNVIIGKDLAYFDAARNISFYFEPKTFDAKYF